MTGDGDRRNPDAGTTDRGNPDAGTTDRGDRRDGAGPGRAEVDGGDDVPGGEVTVLLIDDDETWLRTNARVLERQREGYVVETATTLRAARAAYERLDPDCVVCDYRLEAGDGLDLLADVRADDPDRPFVLVTGEGSEAVASDAIGRRVTDYVRKAAVADRTELLARRIDAAVRTYRTERALERERRSKDALLDIVTARTTREGLAGEFCRHLVADREYACAWIGTYAPAEGVVPQAAAGANEYVRHVIQPGTTPDGADEPALRAVETAEPCVVGDVSAGTSPDSDRVSGAAVDPTAWRTAALDSDFRSAAGVPITQNGTTVGVLAVYATTPDAVDDPERALLTDYASTIGYALRSAEWKESLFGAARVTADLTVGDGDVALVGLCRALSTAATVTARTAALRKDDQVLYLATVAGTDPDDVRDAAERVDAVSSVTVEAGEGPGDGDLRCELVVATPTPESLLVDSGAHFVETTADGTGARVTVATSGRDAIANLKETLAERYEDVALGSLRSEADVSGTRPTSALTDRQREAIRLAFDRGYFERPRRHNTTELAAKLGVSRTTFTQHVRSAERKILDDVLNTTE